jgi:hypothetical protein
VFAIVSGTVGTVQIEPSNSQSHVRDLDRVKVEFNGK